MLRWRILIGLISIVILLLAAGSYSIWLLARLEKRIDSILTENYESIREAHGIRITILRLNAFYFRDQGGGGYHQLGPEPLETRFEPRLERALAALRLLAKSRAEAELAETLSVEVRAFLDAFRAGFQLDRADEDAYRVFRDSLLAQNLALTETTEKILALNEAAMLRARERTRMLVTDTIRFLLGAMALAIAVFVYTYIKLGRALIGPIEELRRSIDAVKARNFEQNIPVLSNDELGDLARAFNDMAGELRLFRRETDDTILRLNRSIRETIAAFPYPVILLDAAGAIWVTNQAAEKFLSGIGSPDRLPDSLSRQIADVRRHDKDYLPDGLHEATLFRIGDRELHFLPRILRVFSPEGEQAGAAVILLDVSRFRWLDDMKTNLISTVSHEIKTPLTGIRMILHLLLEKSCGDLTPMQEEMVQSACDDCERLLTTLNSLLELSRIEAGRTHLDLAPLAPREILEEARAAFQTQADARGIGFTVDAPEDLSRILADRKRIMHVIGNFVSNALKFAPENSTVALVADRPGSDFIRLSVIDSGPGVPPEHQSRIFDKFFRAPSQKAEGVGLGLAIAREIIHAHDGRIGFQTDPHKATRFYCELPIA